MLAATNVGYYIPPSRNFLAKAYSSELFKVVFLTKGVVDDKMVSSGLSILKPSSVLWGAQICYAPGVFKPKHICHNAPHRSDYCIVVLQPHQSLQGGYDDLFDNL